MTSTSSSSAATQTAYRRLLSYVWPYRYALLLAIIGNMLYGIVDVSLLELVKRLIDQGFIDHNKTFIQWIPFIIIGIFIVRGLASFLSTFFMGWVGRNVVMNIRQQMFNHLMRLPSEYFDRTTSGEILAKITYNVEQVAEASTDALSELVRESCVTIGVFAYMLYISWRLTILFIVIAPIMAAIMLVVSKRMRTVSSKTQESVAGVTHVAEEAIEGQKVIKAFGGQAYEAAQFEKVTQHNRRQEMKMIATSALSIPVVQLVGAMALAVTVYLATLDPEHVLRTSISPGAFAVMLGAMVSLLKPLKQLTKVNSNIQKGIANAMSIFAFLDEKPEEDHGTKTLKQVQGNIVFRDVNFSYSEASSVEKKEGASSTLENINFEVKPGEIIAIVGRSGGGKSTIVNLLPRFYEAKGEILLDGINVKDIPLSFLRHQIAIVSQQVTLFNDTIARNIAYGCEASMEEIIKAAESAYAKDFIERLPQGFNTLIGENGIRLSGGQRQRIAIARAVLKKAPILILDEATSALDTESERHIQAALDRLMRQCTTLVIAHRLSTIENANRIIVVDKGHIVEIGTHEELIRTNGVYAQLRAMQSSPFELQPMNVTESA
jgi:subfamily B ATP-binding cassette protein MsbA